jgi:putative (di)nucleoside polyphosphate hydrolase
MFRKGVSAIIINDKNEFLLVNLESFEERFFAIPGGGVEQGELLEDAVYRELSEELGIKKDYLEMVGQSDSPVRFRFKKAMNRDGEVFEGSERYFFGFRFIGNENTIMPSPGEVRSHKWAKFKELKGSLLFDNQLQDTLVKIEELFPGLPVFDAR